MKSPPDPLSQNSTSATNWSVYIILCSDGSFYTGITTEPERRFRQHADGRGAKFFRTRQPVEIIYLEPGHTRSMACRREIQIKNMTKKEKSALICFATGQTPPSESLAGE